MSYTIGKYNKYAGMGRTYVCIPKQQLFGHTTVVYNQI